MTAIPYWESYPLEDGASGQCERCGALTEVRCFDHEVPNPPKILLLCDRCSTVEGGRRMAVHLREYLVGFPEQPTDEDFRALAWGKFLGKEEPPDETASSA